MLLLRPEQGRKRAWLEGIAWHIRNVPRLLQLAEQEPGRLRPHRPRPDLPAVISIIDNMRTKSNGDDEDLCGI